MAAWFAGGALLLATPAQAAPEAETALDGDDPRAVVTLVTDVDAVPAGGSFRVGVHFRLDPGWHVYWANLSTEPEKAPS